MLTRLLHLAAFASATALLGSLCAPLSSGQSTPPTNEPAGVARGQLAGSATDDWLRQVSTAIRREEYQFHTAGAAAWSGFNRSQVLSARVDAGGLQVSPVGDDPSSGAECWQLRLRTTSFGRAGCRRVLDAGTPSAHGARVELDHGDLTEWFANDERGIEQGWTISARPSGDGPLLIGLQFVTELALRIEEGSTSARFVDAAGETRAYYSGLVAWDAGGRDLHAWLEPGAAGLDVCVDDEDARYPITVDPLITTPSWTVVGNIKGATYGLSVSSAGDVNGDGFDDVIVGAGYYTAGETAEGRALVYHGSAAGLSTTEAWTAESNQVAAHFGGSVSSAGDVNGDGFADIIVGAETFGHGEWHEGRAYVFHGSPAGLSPAAAWIVESNQIGANLGTSVSDAGDVNGDGYDDVIVGALRFDHGEMDEGQALVYHGSAAGLSHSPDWSAELDVIDALFGTSVSSAGDVNGDGYADVIVGARQYGNGEGGEGRADIFHGSPSGLANTSAWSVESNLVGAFFGFSVSAAGDVNGDGYGDVIIGAPGYDKPQTNPQTNAGRAYVYRGSATGVEPGAAWIAELSNPGQYGGIQGAQMGYSVSTAGDINGDGYADVLVGAPGYGILLGLAREGRVNAYYGSAAGLGLTELWSAAGNKSGAKLGWSVSSAGDVNGDGFLDVIFGAPLYSSFASAQGRVTLYLGVPETLVETYCTAGTSLNGCTGAISAGGYASATDSFGFDLIANGVPSGINGLFFFGSSGRQALPWGNGTSYQCVVGPLGRGTMHFSTGLAGKCTGQLKQDFNTLWCPSCPKPQLNPGAGTVVQAQAWSLDPFNTSQLRSSLSDAIEFVVGP